MLSKKRGAYFHRDGSTGASAKEWEGVLQSETLHFSDVTLSLALDPNVEVSFLSSSGNKLESLYLLNFGMGRLKLEDLAWATPLVQNTLQGEH